MGRSKQELTSMRDELMRRDIDQITQIRDYGVDLDKERQIDLTFWATEESAAKVFVEACKRNEMPPRTVLGPNLFGSKSTLADSLPH